MTGGASVLDGAALDTLREMVGDEFVGDLIGEFLADAPPLLVSLRTALEQGDAEAARRAAHTLKSNGSTFGATALAHLCRELEERAKADRATDAEALLQRVEEEYPRVEAALTALRQEGGP